MTHLPKTQRQRHRQRGQAMTEFIVVTALVLAPLYLIIPVLGKHIDMKSATIVGARYAAWERTVFFGGSNASAKVDWPGVEKSNDEILNEVRQRVISSKSVVDPKDSKKFIGRPIAATDKAATGWSPAGYRAAWKNHNGSVMLSKYEMVTQTQSQTASPGVANDVIGVVVKIADALGPFTLEMHGLHTAQVSVQAYTLPIGKSLSGGTGPDTFNPGTLTFTDKNTILVNTWNANGRDHVKKQTQGLTPTGVFQTEAGKILLTVVKAVVGVAMPEIWFLELGKIEPDVVPEDRLAK